MWVLLSREPRPDAPYWPGRRWLAAVDGMGWPLLWVWAVHLLPTAQGLLGPFVAALSLLCAIGRVRRALWLNHRYRFTTWRWGRVVGALLLMGLALKFLLGA